MIDNLYKCKKSTENLIYSCKENQDTALILEEKNLTEIPEDIFQFTHLTKLNLYGNKLANLPEQLFNSLVNLLWLDVRNNIVTVIPRSICKLHKLTHLLVGNNNITRLPIEIGGLLELKALNVDQKNLTFPPVEILSGGSKCIIEYLRKCFERKNELKANQHYLNEKIAENNHGIVKSTTASSVGDDTTEIADKHENDLDEMACSWVKTTNDERTDMKDPDQSNKLVNLKAYKQIKKEFFDGLKRKKKFCPRNIWSALPSQSQRHIYLLGDYPKPFTLEQLENSQKLQRVSLKQQKKLALQDEIIQKQKNIDSVKKWKQQYRKKQLLQNAVYLSKPIESIKHDAYDRIQSAPFDTNNNTLLVMCANDLDKLKTQARPGIAQEPLPLHLEKSVLFRMEKERLKKDKMLCDKIRLHAKNLQEKTKNPIRGCREELENAQFDLSMALQLQLRVQKRRDVITQLKMATHPTGFY